MLQIRGLRACKFNILLGFKQPVGVNTRFFSSVKECDPLRILFCGSDTFSNASLRGVAKLQESEPDLIESIDVVSRPPKRYGRGMKELREVPIADQARILNFPLHQVDTFTGWEPPKDINLVIAVSFGLLVPSRILNGAKYGGLNVHPSLLPDFRGAAPIHWALLNGRTETGVTIQTLHPTKMDHGQILHQSTPFPIPDADTTTPSILTDYVAPKGEQLLVECIKNRLFVPPVIDYAKALNAEEEAALQRAPKITPEDRHLDWFSWDEEEILRRQRVIGQLWNKLRHSEMGEAVRVIWTEGFRKATSRDFAFLQAQLSDEDFVGQIRLVKNKLFLRTKEGEFLVTDRVKVEGRPVLPVHDALGRFFRGESGKDTLCLE